MIRDVRLGHSDERREVHQDLQDGPAEDGDLFVVGGHGPVDDSKFFGAGVEAQHLPDGTHIRLDARVHLPAESQERGFFAIDLA
jgi:hypothetical protein